MARTRSRREQEIRELLARRQAEGLTYRELAAKAGLKAGTLAWWQRQIRLRDKGEAGSQQSAGPTRNPSSFVEVQLNREGGTRIAAPGSALGFELCLGRGTLRIPAEFDAPALQRLLAVLEGRC